MDRGDGPEACGVNHDDPLPDTRPYTLAAAFLSKNRFADVRWRVGGDGLMRPMAGPDEDGQDRPAIIVHRLRHWREEFYKFTGSAYRRSVLEELMGELTRFMNEQTYFGPKNKIRPMRVTCGVERDTITQLRRICQVHSETMPIWIDATDRPDPRRVIAFHNGILDIDEWLRDSRVQLIPSTEDWFSQSVIPCQFDIDAKCPAWEEFLDQALDNDAELIALLQEWFGYCLTTDTTFHKMLWMHGVSRGGKSTVANVLRKVVGQRNCVSFDLWSLLGQFTLSAFVGKNVAISADAHLGNSHEADKVLAKLKGISGGDEQQVDRKNREILESVLLTVRFVVSTNEFPNLPDASDALATRALFIPFNRSFKGVENIHLAEQLERELAGITVWALRGLRRLLDQDHFSEAKAAREVANEFKRIQSPVFAYAEDCLNQVPYVAPDNRAGLGSGCVRCDTAYEVFCGWAKASGRGQLGREKFGERLKRVLPQVTRSHKMRDGGQFWEYRGIEIKDWALLQYGKKQEPML